MTRTWTLHFRSPLITDSTDHHYFVTKFSTYGKTQKVYLNYHGQTGYAIFDTKYSAEYAKEDLSKVNDLLITIDSLQLSDMENTYSVANTLYDIYGNEVPCIALENGERHIPLTKMESLGFQFFESPCLGKDDDENMLIALTEYLKVQLQIFMRVQGNVLNSEKVNWLMHHFFSSLKDQQMNEPEGYSKPKQRCATTEAPKKNVVHKDHNRTVQEMMRNFKPNNNADSLKKSPGNYPVKAERGPRKVNENGKSTNSCSSRKNKSAEEIGKTVSMETSSQSNICKTMMGLKRVINNMQQYCRRSIADSLANTSGIVTITEIIDATVFIATIFPSTCSDDVLTLEEISPDIKACGIINYKPKVGEVVAVQNETNFWVRGFVIDFTADDKMKVGLVDYGTVILTERACVLPARFRTIPEYAVKCTSTKQMVAMLKINSDMEYYSAENNTFTINRSNEITCSLWNPLEDTKGTSQAVILEIPSRSKNLQIKELAILINVKKDGYLYLRTFAHNQTIRTLQSSINQIKLQKLDGAPIFNQLVIHKLKDHYSRAVVTDIISSKKVVLRYIDYEMNGEVDVDSLFYIDKFADQEIPLVEVKLKGFESNGFSEKALLFVNSLNMTKLSVESYNASSGVVELSKDNQPLNVLIEKVEKPGYPRYQDLGMRKLIIGKKYRMLLIEHDVKKTLCHCMLSDETVQAEFIKICKIIEQKKNLAYPLNLHVDELCVAKYEFDWFRGQVLEIESDGRACMIYFIDFGNVSRVEFENIRSIPEELLEFPPMAMKTIFAGPIPADVYQVYDMVVREIQPSKYTYIIDWIE